jgi:hypothetical protein
MSASVGRRSIISRALAQGFWPSHLHLALPSMRVYYVLALCVPNSAKVSEADDVRARCTASAPASVGLGQTCSLDPSGSQGGS